MASSAWIGFHFYPKETDNVFLRRALRPFLAQNVWPVPGARAFFIRFNDGKGPHIRLRLRGDEAFSESIEPLVLQHFAARGDILKTAYEPETERFGGPGGLAWAEEYFHQSTRLALDRLDRDEHTYGDAMFDALRLHAMALFAAGFDAKKTGWYFSKLCDQWLPLFFQPEKGASKNPGVSNDPKNWQEDVKAGFRYNLEPQRLTLTNAMDRFWRDLQKGKIDKTRPEWLRWLRANEFILKELGDNLEKALPSLLHLTNNRLGISNPDEVYLNYILSKIL